MVEVSVDEPVLRPASEREVIHEYGRPVDTRVKVSSRPGIQFAPFLMSDALKLTGILF